MFWILPLAAAAIALVPIMALARRLASEMGLLRGELDRFSDLRPALLELGSDARALRAVAAGRAARLPGARPLR